MSPRKGGLGRRSGKKQACKQKFIYDTSSTKRKRDISRQLHGISRYTDLISNVGDQIIYPPLYYHTENAVYVIFDNNQIEYPPLYDQKGTTIRIMIDDNLTHHGNRQPPEEVCCGIK